MGEQFIDDLLLMLKNAMQDMKCRKDKQIVKEIYNYVEEHQQKVVN